ncbi:MAG: thiamine phosphate synthase [Burkholderiales bacterium]|nr:thiamine phosphate synthase [Burkholderiales bacterium]
MKKSQSFRGPFPGLYAITPDRADTGVLINEVRQALEGGARLIQYRNKSADEVLRLQQARRLVDLCKEFEVALIVNDSVALAEKSGAHGVHLGCDDAAIDAARRRLGAAKIIGASAYASIGRAREAEALGADYVAFGSFFASTVKPAAPRAPLALLADAKAHFDIPVVAIGGITLDNAPALIEAGADGLAVISALFGAPDIRQAARQFARMFAAASCRT